MKLLNLLYAVLVLVGFYSCSDWTEIERNVFEEQENVNRYIPLIEADSEDDLTPSMREHFAKIREYRKTEHVIAFGWYGNWTGTGTNPQSYLKMLPDSIDMVSLWGTRGNISQAQLTDLRFYQNVKGGKALMCWIVSDLGDGITPIEYQDDPDAFWIDMKGGGDEFEGVKAYANAICDTIDKYGLDGFDIDYEPLGGHGGNMANDQEISMGGNKRMQIFIETMSARLRPSGKILAMDGDARLLSTATSELVDYYIYQAYNCYATSDPTIPSLGVMGKVEAGKHLTDYIRKSIVTVNGEKYWQTGGLPKYASSAHPEFSKIGAPQLLDYATLDIDGKRIGGFGMYHIEYDYKNNPEYRWMRLAMYYANQVYPGNFN